MGAYIDELNRQARATLSTPGPITLEQYKCVRRLGALMDDETRKMWAEFNGQRINPVTYVVEEAR